MSEKRGNTGKLIYEFDTALELEVQMKETWYRVTARDFRSFNGPRRISKMPYEGKLYFFGTNTVVENPTKQGLLYVDDINPRDELNKRINER